MKVVIGSARIDENGKAYGGSPGDQTGKEVSIQNWYKHSKGWRVFRANSSEHAQRIALEMANACNNAHIGYDQWNRNTLFAEAEKVGFDLSKVSNPCETDCSALVRVCIAAIGYTLPSNTNTQNLPARLLSSGMFAELTGAEYTDQSDNLQTGDILCTATKGHVVVVIEGNTPTETGVEEVPTIRKGSKGLSVRLAQRLLNAHGERLEIDGDFGRLTTNAVVKYQKANGLDTDGIIGPKTWYALSI